MLLALSILSSDSSSNSSPRGSTDELSVTFDQRKLAAYIALPLSETRSSTPFPAGTSEPTSPSASLAPSPRKTSGSLPSSPTKELESQQAPKCSAFRRILGRGGSTGSLLVVKATTTLLGSTTQPAQESLKTNNGHSELTLETFKLLIHDNKSPKTLRKMIELLLTQYVKIHTQEPLKSLVINALEEGLLLDIQAAKSRLLIAPSDSATVSQLANLRLQLITLQASLLIDESMGLFAH